MRPVPYRRMVSIRQSMTASVPMNDEPRMRSSSATGAGGRQRAKGSGRTQTTWHTITDGTPTAGDGHDQRPNLEIQDAT